MQLVQTDGYKHNTKVLDSEIEFTRFAKTSKTIKKMGQTGNYYYGARYYNPKFSIWLSVDPLTEKYPSHSPYNYTLNNPINFVDPDGRENIPALIWAMKNMANKGIPFRTWYGGNGGWKFNKGKVPTETVCYESCWTSYMNGADASTMSI